jgi:SAM-dependent methyltransferase
MECRCCKVMLSSENSLTLKGFVLGTKYRVFECITCGSLQTSFNFDDDPTLIYNSIYKNASIISGYKRYFIYSKLFYFLLKTRLFNPLYVDKLYYNVWKIIEINKIAKNQSILDLGCGLGYFTAALRRLGFNSFGVDLSSEAIQSAIKSYGPFFQQVDITDANSSIGREKYDVIVCLEIIEHLDNIDSFLQGVLDRLSDRGMAIISTPVSKSNRLWASTEPPIHLTQLSEIGIRKLSERFGCDVTFYSDMPVRKCSDLDSVGGSILPGGVLKSDFSVNLNYPDNGSFGFRNWFLLIFRMMINSLRFKFTIPIAVKENVHSVGSYIFVVKKQQIK